MSKNRRKEKMGWIAYFPTAEQANPLNLKGSIRKSNYGRGYYFVTEAGGVIHKGELRNVL